MVAHGDIRYNLSLRFSSYRAHSKALIKVIARLDGMSKQLDEPYIVFYPVISSDGRSFPVNRTIRSIQCKKWRPEVAWRGNLIVAKYKDKHCLQMTDARMGDYALMSNWFLTHNSPVRTETSSLQLPTPSTPGPSKSTIESGSLNTSNDVTPHTFMEYVPETLSFVTRH